MATLTTNLNIRLDRQVKEQAEAVFTELGMNMTTAINLFLRACIREHGIPFDLKLEMEDTTKRFGVAQGKLQVPDDIDLCNDGVADVFGGQSRTRERCEKVEQV